jgi:intein/homing endonuclease
MKPTIADMKKALVNMYGAYADKDYYEEVEAIRALIEAALGEGGWVERAGEIKDVIYKGDDWDIASALIREIRDFGEEKK